MLVGSCVGCIWVNLGLNIKSIFLFNIWIFYKTHGILHQPQYFDFSFNLSILNYIIFPFLNSFCMFLVIVCTVFFQNQMYKQAQRF